MARGNINNNTNSSILDSIKSPTGVVDFLQVDQEQVAKAFSWVEYPGGGGNDNKKKKTSKKFLGTNNKTNNKTLGSSSSSSIQEQIKEVQKQILWIERQGGKDKEAYQDQLRAAKAEIREAIYDKYEPLLQQVANNNNDHAGKVIETTKVINYLREDNARLREEIKGLQRGIAQLKQKNAEVQAANARAQESYQELLDHVQGLVAVQDKLQTNVEVFQRTVKQMKADYSKRNAYFQMEANTVAKYESGLAKVLTQVQNANHPVLLAELYEIVSEEGGASVAEGRQQALSKAGLTMDAKQTLQTQKLLNPVLLIAEQRRMDAGDSDSDDSDDEDDSSSSSSEQESDGDSNKHGCYKW